MSNAHEEQQKIIEMEGKNRAVKLEDVAGVHPFADQFPMLLPSEMDELVESVKANGLRNPIVLTPAEEAGKWLILDGRNRFAACQRAEVEPTFVVYEGDDLAQYVIDTNTTRRNLTTGQRAMATALVLQADGCRKKNDKGEGYWKRGSVVNPDVGINDGKTWQNALNQCGVILDWAEDLAEKVRDGAELLNTVYKKAVERRTAKDQDAELLRTIQAEIPNTAEKIAAGEMTLEEGKEELSASRYVKKIDVLVAETGLRTYGSRAEADDIKWVEAKRLAEEWHKEWLSGVERDSRRVFDAVASWASLKKLLDAPEKVANRAVMEKLGDQLVEKIHDIVREIEDNAATWKGNF